MQHTGDLMTVFDTAEFLGLSEETVRHLAERGVLGAIRDGDALLLRRSDVAAYRNSGVELPGDGVVNDLMRDRLANEPR